VDFAELTGLSKTGLNNIELGLSNPKVSTMAVIRAALESARVIFVEENGGGPGLRKRK
jgi:transcriptional regulator with XRE-family HTH domain